MSSEVLFDLPKKRRRIEELSQISTQDGFWDDNRRARTLTTEKSRLESETKEFDDLERAYNDVLTLFDLSQELNDPDSLADAGTLIPALRE